MIVLSGVEVPVGDLGRAISWYREALGLACTWSDAGHAMLASASMSILLVETNDGIRLGFTRNGLRHSVVDFRTDDLEGLHRRLVGLGCDVDALGPQVNDWAPRGFGMMDSEGNRLGAFTYGGAGSA